MSDSPQLALFHHLRGNNLLRTPVEETELQTIHPNREQLLRRDAIVPEDQREREADAKDVNGTTAPTDNVIIVPHVQITTNESHLINRAISSGGGLLADLQRATMATQAFYAENETNKTRSPWILRRLYEWSHRAKAREMIKHVHAALDEAPPDVDSEDAKLAKWLNVNYEDMFPGASRLDDDHDKKRLQAVWELFHSELVFLHKQLLVLKHVYKEPLKKCQVEGCLLTAEPELLFGNLDQLCRISRKFCQSFLQLLNDVQAAGAESRYETTELVVELFERFSKGPSTISAYQAYCINYKATIEYLGSVRQREERFVDFERVCMSDPRCGRLQLEDLLIAPLQRITRLPILLREILKYTEGFEEKAKLQLVLDTMNENLRSIDDSVQWLHNFERLQQLQTLVIWPPVLEMEPKTFIPDFLKTALSRQFCENLLAHPRRKLVHEGPLEFVENGKCTDCYAFLFNDMFLITKIKKVAVKSKKSTHTTKTEYYIVHKQPVPLDSCVFCDADSDENHSNVSLKNAFVVIHLTRYYQVVSVYTMQAPTKTEKDIWIEKFQESIENYESIQLRDMLRCTPLFSSISLRRSSSSRYMSSTSCASSRQRSLHGH
uniref:Pleckstrin homology domain-containing family G member 7 n=1 Tax=Panagrellus redivivus TaxID=6233 RepID=A0A7E4US73_PANRE